MHRDIVCPELSDRSIGTLLTDEIFVGQKFQKDQPLKITENLPTGRKCIQISQTVIISTAQAERQFSKLKLIKSRLRTKISQDRLSNIATLNSNKDTTNSISDESILEAFLSKKDRRILL